MYSCDFETTTEIDDCRVWAAGAYEIYKDEFIHFNSIGKFLEWCGKIAPYRLSFHNLKFDGEFIISYLLSNGFEYVKARHPKQNQFTCLIGDMGQFYNINIRYKKGLISIFDSLKVLNSSVSRLAKDFGLKESKLEIDYNHPRPIGHKLTFEEVEYLKNDCVIVGKSLKALYDIGLDATTQAGNAFKDYKKIIGGKRFERAFPVPYYDKDIRQSYKGGYVYVNPIYKGKTIGEGLVLDVNSMYPWAMRYCMLPFGEGIFFNGQYENDEAYPLYIQQIVCEFELKKGKLPTIQIKNNRFNFSPTDYLTSSDGNEVALTLTSIDLKLFLENYEVYNIDYIAGWKFRQSNDLFVEYIDKWTANKIKAKNEKNESMYAISKIMLNSLYGRFAINPVVGSKYPVLENGIVKYKNHEQEEREPVYVPVASFITAYSRNKLIRTAQKCGDRFIYCDTDSIHLVGTDAPPGLDIHDSRLGAWKVEDTFTKAKYLRAKTYIEVIDNKMHIKCAGMPSNLYKQVTFDNFSHGQQYPGKLLPKHVKGGIILDETLFTIK